MRYTSFSLPNGCNSNSPFLQFQEKQHRRRPGKNCPPPGGLPQPGRSNGNSKTIETMYPTAEEPKTKRMPLKSRDL
jgi:hypothetical protein